MRFHILAETQEFHFLIVYMLGEKQNSHLGFFRKLSAADTTYLINYMHE